MSNVSSKVLTLAKVSTVLKTPRHDSEELTAGSQLGISSAKPNPHHPATTTMQHTGQRICNCFKTHLGDSKCEQKPVAGFTLRHIVIKGLEAEGAEATTYKHDVLCTARVCSRHR